MQTTICCVTAASSSKLLFTSFNLYLCLAVKTIEDLIDLSYNEVVYQKQLNNVTDKVYGHYMFLWLWSCCRSYDCRHQVFYNKYGAERYWRRIDRVLAYATAIRKRKREQLLIGRSRIATV